MNIAKSLTIPDKLFGIDSGLIVVFLPPIGLFLLLLVIFNLLIFPKFSEISDIYAKASITENEMNQVIAKRNYLSSIDQEELIKNERFISNSLLPEKNSYLLVNIIRKIADKYGFQVASFLINLGDVKKEDTVVTVDAVAKVPVKLTLVGSKAQYLDFVNGLEKSLPLLSIDNFNMTVTGEQVALDLTVSSSYIQDKTAVNPSKLSLADLTMTKSESDLLSRLNEEFTVVESLDMAQAISNGKGYTKYDRKNPFSP
ncbi:hypothetical protein KBC75_04390 [Candidatus Shapirobacteria bacterium]|nr:hypothetical protein [Candidatus Shapirobacteria bacterium]